VVESTKKAATAPVVASMKSEELVKEKSTPAISMGTIVEISNCLMGSFATVVHS
jgi:hypothetical protein